MAVWKQILFNILVKLYYINLLALVEEDGDSDCLLYSLMGILPVSRQFMPGPKFMIMIYIVGLVLPIS